ncbi:MAG TPA: DUF6081 family protein [Ktedonobacteraceae bacterium]|nr:DUF6081 family protein [Ktedonobacteraceae bacterium]
MKTIEPDTLAEKEPQEDSVAYAGYHSIITGVDRAWQYGGFPLPDGSFWRYREPNAAVVVEGERMRVSAKITRANNDVQILDNAKNMFFSTRTFEAPEKGEISFEWDMQARCAFTTPGDLYDGFVSVNLLDFSTGVALDFFTCNDLIATVYALLPFPGVPEPADVEDAQKPKYFCDFNELSLPTTPGQTHRYRINYHRGKDEVRFYVDGQEVGTYSEVPVKMNRFIIALGLMTEKTIEQGKSVSVHGQVLTGVWGKFTITMRAE